VSGHDVVEQAALWVVGIDDGARSDEVVTFRLAHGEDPEAGLRSRGFEPLAADSVVGQAVPHELRLVYRVRRAHGIPQPAASEPPVDARLVRVPGEVPVAYQRLAAYAVVHSSRGVLLSQASGRTNAPGSWGLCGGGVDPGELPEEALHREVWEETSQKITVTGLARISTRHWIGRAPYGRLEDFHAVRIVYHATCPEPTDPAVLDADGTTAASAWVPTVDVPRLALTPGWRDIVIRLLDADQ
jgi:8-oxo-dGTP pyrophosphatase MutT (NUDIX family)